MAPTRTARGTASDKNPGPTLTIPSFTVPAGHSLVVGGGYDNAQGAPSTVIHAGRHLRRKVQRDDTTNGVHGSSWIKGEYHREQTGTCVLTWAASIGKKTAVASSFDCAHKLDDSSGNIEATAVTNPGTGLTGTLDSAEGFAVCHFVSEGPGSDHGSATADILDGGSFQPATIGQIEGTAGAPPISNVTIVETFLNLTATNATRGRLQSATSRTWVCLILALEPRATLSQQGVSISDIVAVETIVAAAGGDVADIVFGWNEDTGEYEAFEIAAPGAAVARYDLTDGWVAP